MRRAFYRSLRALLWATLGLAFRLKVTGAELLPSTGAVVLAANHRHNLDPVFLALAARRPVAYMAKAELFDVPILGALIGLLYAFPVHRGAGDRAALRAAADVLKRGQVLGLFPEGTRQPGPGLGPAQPGAALLAMQAAAPIVPAALVGTDRLFARTLGIPLPRKVRVRFGPPIPPQAGAADRREARRRLTEAMMDSLKDLGGFEA